MGKNKKRRKKYRLIIPHIAVKNDYNNERRLALIRRDNIETLPWLLRLFFNSINK